MPMFTQKSIEALRNLMTHQTRVVLTTSHRERFTGDQWIKIFANRGIEIGSLSTLGPNPNFKKRKDEIQEWLTVHSIDEDFVIIDDDTSLHGLPKPLKEHVILTNSLIGLTAEEVADAKESLHVA